MTEVDYGIIKAIPSYPSRDLLRVPHKNRKLIVGYPAFGPDINPLNITEMEKTYYHSKDLPMMSFREPTTSESISASVYNFEKMAQPQILDSRWFQIGRIVRVSEGIFANPPKDAQGNFITIEEKLINLLNKGNKVDGIYLCENDFGFAPYKTFKQGPQSSEEFVQGGLARLLEHTPETPARNLGIIVSPKFYKGGVNVSGFDKVKEPILGVMSMCSAGDFDDRGIWVVIEGWDKNYEGFAFGVLNSA